MEIRILLSCGLIAPICYLVTDLLVGSLINGYSFSAQTMSDISAISSPKRSIAVLLTFVSCAIMTLFGIGILQSTGQSILIQILGLLVIGNSILGLVANLFFPNRYGERPKFVSPGVLLMFTSVLLFIIAMIIGAMAFNSWFRLFSISIPIAYVLLAVIRFTSASKSSSEETKILIGTQERTMAYSFLLWVFVLSIYLISIV